jgi:hypothetical protein
MREDQTDTCHRSGSCGPGCRTCASKVQINFAPLDIRAQWLMGGTDPKLNSVGSPSDNA